MSKKSPKIASLIASCQGDTRYDAHYLGYFKCFNDQLYYEAHDVLEELWLADRKGLKANYYQGLIQVAGAFVHLQKNRLEPASRLFILALKNLDSYPSPHDGLDLEQTRQLCRSYLKSLQKNNFQVNPWTTKSAPRLVIS